MVCVIYAITAVYGPTFWDQGILSFLHLADTSLFKSLPITDLPLNECFLVFGCFALASNIWGSYANVYKAKKKKGESPFAPLLGLLPFVINSTANLVWLANADSIRTRHLLPFAVFWGE